MTARIRPAAALRVGAAALALLAAAPATAAVAKARKAPAGLAFYTPPKPLPAGKPGTVIWSRPASKQASLAGAAKNLTVLYRSTDTSGKPIAVSGLVSIPKGKAPKGGWPVISLVARHHRHRRRLRAVARLGHLTGPRLRRVRPPAC